MKKLDLNNTVIEVLNKEHAKKVKAFFERQGIDVSYFSFSATREGFNAFAFYGKQRGVFRNYQKPLPGSGIRIATLEELEAEENYEGLHYVANKDLWGVNGTFIRKGEEFIPSLAPKTMEYFKTIGLLQNQEYFTEMRVFENVKVGDKVITRGYSNDYDGKVLTISRIFSLASASTKKRYCEFVESASSLDNFCTDKIERYATSEEIKKSQLPKEGSYCKKTWIRPEANGQVDYFIAKNVTGERIGASEYFRFYKSGKFYDLSNQANSRELSASLTDDRYVVSVITEREFNEAKSKGLAAKKIVIGEKYEVTFNTNASLYDTEIAATGFSKDFWIAALKVSKHSKAAVVVGCNAKGLGTHKWEVSQEQIERILEELK